MGSDVTVTDEAAEILARSLALAGVDRAGGGIRLRGSTRLGGGFEVQVELADGPAEGDEVVHRGDLTLFLDPAVTAEFPAAIIGVEPEHEKIVVRPAKPGAP